MSGRLLLAIIFLCFSSWGMAQQAKTLFDQYTIRDGLSHNTVNSIVQDDLGFLWFGTLDGLCRFDGNNFKVFKSTPGDKNSLCHSMIKSVCLDKNGNLWIGTARGISVMHISTGRFSHFFAEDSSGLSHNNIEVVYCDSKGVIWVATQGGGLNRFNEKDGRFSQFRAGEKPGDLSNDNVHWIFEDRYGVLWIGTESGGLNRLRKDEQTFDFFQFEPEDGNYQALNCVRSIQQDVQGNIWVGTWGGGAAVFDRKEEAFTYYRKEQEKSGGLNDSRVISILSSSNDQLWLGTEDGGLNRFDFRDKSFEVIKMERLSPFGLKSNNIRSIYEDHSKRIWLGTSGGGVFSFIPGEPGFSMIQINNEQMEPAENQDVYAIAGNENSLWFGTNGSGLFRGLKNNNGDSDITSFQQIELSSDIVHSLCFDNWGRLWAGTLGGGLNLIEYGKDSGKPAVTNFNINKAGPNTVSYNDIRCLYNDKRGNLWIGTAGGGLDKIVVAKKGEYYFEHYRHEEGDVSSLSNNDVRAITEDHSGNIWVGTAFGLNRLSSSEDPCEIENYYASTTENGSISGNWINALYVDDEGFLWVGSDAGLNRIDVKSGEIKVFTASDGLVNNIVKAITGDGHGNLWITSVNGISMFSKADGTFYNFFESDGLLNNEFNSNAVYVNPEGKVFIGGTQGVNYFSSQKVLRYNQINALYFTEFELFNQPIKAGAEINGRVLLENDILQQESLNLKYYENSFTFKFAALDYTNAKKITYQYRLEGFDKDWQETVADQRIATYTNLGGGDYTFKVKAITGVPGDDVHEKSIAVHIDFPLWLRWWAFVIYGFLLTSIVFLVRRYYKARTRFQEDLRIANLERKKEHELIELKQRFFMNVSHELKTPLTLILGPLESVMHGNEISEKQSKLLVLIKRNVDILSRLITQMMDFSKQERGVLKLNTERIDLLAFLQEILLSFSDLARQQKIAFRFHTELDELYVLIDREKIEKVVFNLLSNAFKYTPPNGTIDIELSVEENKTRHFLLEIQDSGKGIRQEHQQRIFERFYQVSNNDSETGTGIGLSLAKELVELHLGSIKVDSEPGKGSSFTVCIPIKEQFGEDGLEQDETVSGMQKEDEGIEDRSQQLTFVENKKPTILVVEDNYDLCSYLELILSEKYEVQIANNGEEGWQKALEIIPDIIVSDVMMPIMDGATLCKNIKSKLSVSHIPVILLTAKSGKENVLTGFESGADDYVEKPFDTDILLARVETLLENRNRVWMQIQKNPIQKIKENRLTKIDREFLEKLERKVIENMASPNFSVEQLGRQIGMSRATLYRKVKGLTGKTAIEYIRVVRLIQAKKLLEEDSSNCTDVAEQVGFSDIDYFRKCFRNQFGVSPDSL